ncbi:MAG: tetratricopeptide repeat protein [Armatimonadetes bacterium]|nr:tetratricopeptide repeat protein [Armatimonadota bacterium]
MATEFPLVIGFIRAMAKPGPGVYQALHIFVLGSWHQMSVGTSGSNEYGSLDSAVSGRAMRLASGQEFPLRLRKVTCLLNTLEDYYTVEMKGGDQMRHFSMIAIFVQGIVRISRCPATVLTATTFLLTAGFLFCTLGAPAGSPSASGTCTVTVKAQTPDGDAAVEGMRAVVINRRTGRVHDLDTDATGKVLIPERPSSDLILEKLYIMGGSKTKYRFASGREAAGGGVRDPITGGQSQSGLSITLSLRLAKSGTVVRLGFRKLVVSSQKDGQTLPGVVFALSDESGATGFLGSAPSRNTSGSVTFYLPVGQVEYARGRQLTKMKITARYEDPANGRIYLGFIEETYPPAAEQLEVALQSREDWFYVLKKDIREVMAGLVGRADASRIDAVALRYIPQGETPSGENYRNSRINLPVDFNFASSQGAENVFHEWTHAIMELVLNIDEPSVARGSVFMLTDEGGNLIPEPAAWSEGRASFVGVLLSRIRGRPVGQGFTKQIALSCAPLARDDMDAPGAHTEGVICVALLDYYGRKYGDDARGALSDFLGYHRNHAFNNAREFFGNVRAAVDKKEADLVEQLEALYRLKPPPDDFVKAKIVGEAQAVEGKPIELKAEVLTRNGQPLIDDCTGKIRLTWTEGNKVLGDGNSLMYVPAGKGERHIKCAVTWKLTASKERLLADAVHTVTVTGAPLTLEINVSNAQPESGSTVKARAVLKKGAPPAEAMWAWKSSGGLEIVSQKGEQAQVKASGQGKLLVQLYTLSDFGKMHVLAETSVIIKPKGRSVSGGPKQTEPPPPEKPADGDKTAQPPDSEGQGKPEKPVKPEQPKEPEKQPGEKPRPRPFSALTEAERRELLNCICKCSNSITGAHYHPEDVKGASPSCDDKANGPCMGGDWGCYRFFMIASGECIEDCYKAHNVVYDKESSKREITAINKKFMKPLKVELTADKTTLQMGDVANIQASASGGVPGYQYSWSGADTGTAKGDTFAFKDSERPGSHRISVTVRDNHGNTASGSIALTIVALKVEIEKLEPGSNQAPVGGKAKFRATLTLNGKPVSGNYVFRWQPNSELDFKPQESGSSGTDVLFRKSGRVKVWVEVLNKKGDVLSTVAESQQIEMDIISPNLSISFSPSRPLVGQEVKARLAVPTGIKDAHFNWEVPGNARQIAQSNDSFEITLTPKDARPITVVARSAGDLGDASGTIQASLYKVSVQVSLPTTTEWQQGPKGGLKDKETGIAVFQNIRIRAGISPKPPGEVRYEWLLNAGSSFVGNPHTEETTVNRSEVGTCQATMVVRNADGDELGRGSGSFEVTISQEHMKAASDKDKAQKKLEEAHDAERQGDLERAVNLAQEAKNLDPQDRTIRTELERLLSAKGKAESAEDVKQLSNLIQQGQLDEAKALLPELARIAPQAAAELKDKLADAFLQRGREKTDSKDYDGAVSDNTEAIALRPDSRAYNNRAVAYGALGEHQKAVDDYTQAIRLKPGNSNYYVGRGRYKNKLGDTRGAIEDLERAIELQSDNYSAYNNRGAYKERLGDSAGALEDYEKSLKIKPDFELARKNRDILKNKLAQTRERETGKPASPPTPTVQPESAGGNRITGGKASAGTISEPNSKGNPFNGGLWVNSRNGSDWLQLDMDGTYRIEEIRIQTAGTDVTTDGAGIVLKLKRPQGGWVTVDTLSNTNINREKLSGGVTGRSIPNYRKVLASPVEANAFRLELTGHGWFVAQNIQLYGRKTGARTSTVPGGSQPDGPLNVTGTYRTGHYPGPIRLTQSGVNVTGTYDWAGGGRVWGTLEGNILKGNFKDPGHSGDIKFVFSEDGRSYEHWYRFAGDESFVDAGKGVRITP